MRNHSGFGGRSTTYESFTRFWSEVAQPSHAGALSPVPDPYQALGALPSYSASCYDAVAPTGSLPELDPDKCVGCGRCWAECPHSAIGVTAIGTEALLGAAAEFARDPTDERDPIADKIKRAHKQLAAHIDGELAKTGGVTLENVRTIGSSVPRAPGCASTRNRFARARGSALASSNV